jgi:hypothetical protein
MQAFSLEEALTLVTGWTKQIDDIQAMKEKV